MAKKYDIRAKIGEYEKDGETKNRYATLGAVIETKNGGLMMKLDTVPVNWDGVAYFNEPYRKDDAGGEVGEIDRPIDLNGIPF